MGPSKSIRLAVYVMMNVLNDSEVLLRLLDITSIKGTGTSTLSEKTSTSALSIYIYIDVQSTIILGHFSTKPFNKIVNMVLKQCFSTIIALVH
jgi:hypothetical protein